MNTREGTSATSEELQTAVQQDLEALEGYELTHGSFPEMARANQDANG